MGSLQMGHSRVSARFATYGTRKAVYEGLLARGRVVEAYLVWYTAIQQAGWWMSAQRCRYIPVHRTPVQGHWVYLERIVYCG
jgi:hypothetical protein